MSYHRAHQLLRGSNQRLTSGDLGLSKTEPLLRVSALSVDYDAAGGDVVSALRSVDLEIGDGESVGVLGESGSGKSSLALALLRLLPQQRSRGLRKRGVSRTEPDGVFPCTIKRDARRRGSADIARACAGAEPGVVAGHVNSRTCCWRTASSSGKKCPFDAGKCCAKLGSPIRTA